MMSLWCWKRLHGIQKTILEAREDSEDREVIRSFSDLAEGNEFNEVWSLKGTEEVVHFASCNLLTFGNEMILNLFIKFI